MVVASLLLSNLTNLKQNFRGIYYAQNKTQFANQKTKKKYLINQLMQEKYDNYAIIQIFWINKFY